MLFYLPKILHFCSIVVPVPFQGVQDEKGIRCESGTVPAAVIPAQYFRLPHSHCPHKGREGGRKSGKSEDLP